MDMLSDMKKHSVTLTQEEEKTCRAIISRGQNKAEVIRRAYILLKSHDGKTDVDIASELYIDDETVRRTRLCYVQGGLQAAIETGTAPGNEALLNESQVAALTALACSSPPPGQKRWTHQLLAEQMVADGVVVAISASTVGRYLKKTL
jgi:Homeodomain-like domain